MKNKSEVFSKFRDFKALVENQTDRRIKILRSDNGGEYFNSDFNKFLKEGIKHQSTAPHYPQQNCVAERCNRILVEKAKSVLFDANLSKNYWAEAVNHAVYLKNRSPSRAVAGSTPEEKWSGNPIDLSNLKIFGCKAYSLIHKTERNKLDPKSKPMIFTGFCENSKAYRLIDPRNPKVFEKSRSVIFDESSFLGSKLPFDSKTDLNYQSETLPNNVNIPIVIDFSTFENQDSSITDNENETLQEFQESSSEKSTLNTSTESHYSDSNSLPLDPEVFPNAPKENQLEIVTEPVTKVPDDSNSTVSRVRTKPSWMKDYVMFQTVSDVHFDIFPNVADPLTVSEALKSEDKILW